MPCRLERNRSDNPCWPERTELVNTRGAQKYIVWAHRTGRLHGLTERLPVTHGANREFRKMIAQGRHVTPSIESNPLTACTRIGMLRFLEAAYESKQSSIYKEIQSLKLPSYKIEMGVDL